MAPETCTNGHNPNYLRRCLLAALFSCIMPVSTSAQEASGPKSGSFPSFSKDSVTYVYGPNYKTPFVTSPSQPDGADIPRNAIQFTHIDSWKYGSNFIDIKLEAGGGLEYWHNMYGKPADSKPGAKQMTPFVQLTVNLNTRRE